MPVPTAHVPSRSNRLSAEFYQVGLSFRGQPVVDVVAASYALQALFEVVAPFDLTPVDAGVWLVSLPASVVAELAATGHVSLESDGVVLEVES